MTLTDTDRSSIQHDLHEQMQKLERIDNTEPLPGQETQRAIYRTLITREIARLKEQLA